MGECPKAMRKPSSVLVSVLCWAAPVGAFFLVKPWYYGLLAAFGVFLLTGLRGIYWAIRDNRILENALKRFARATPEQIEALRELDRLDAMRAEWYRRVGEIQAQYKRPSR